MKLVDGDFLVRANGDHLLREDVERVPRDPRLLDLAFTHCTSHDSRLEEIGSELGEDPTLRDRVEIVPRPTHALEPASDRLRALDLDHEIDGTHVDPELERRCRNEARDPSSLEQLLHDDPLLARQ